MANWYFVVSLYKARSYTIFGKSPISTPSVVFIKGRYLSLIYKFITAIGITREVLART